MKSDIEASETNQSTIDDASSLSRAVVEKSDESSSAITHEVETKDPLEMEPAARKVSYIASALLQHNKRTQPKKMLRYLEQPSLNNFSTLSDDAII